jgi:predicted DNA-binding transcriptional regulator AlpA
MSRILRAKDAMAKTGQGQNTLYRHARTGLLPSPIRIGRVAMGWIESELDSVLEARARGATTEEIRAIVKGINDARGWTPDAAKQADYAARSSKRIDTLKRRKQASLGEG